MESSACWCRFPIGCWCWTHRWTQEAGLPGKPLEQTVGARFLACCQRCFSPWPLCSLSALGSLFCGDVWVPLGSPQPWPCAAFCCVASFRLPCAGSSKIYVFVQNPGLQASPSSALASLPWSLPMLHRLLDSRPTTLRLRERHSFLLPSARVRALILEPTFPSHVRTAVGDFPEHRGASGPLRTTLQRPLGPRHVKLLHVALKGRTLPLHFLLHSSRFSSRSQHALNPVGALVGAAVLKFHEWGGFDSSNGVSHGPGGHELRWRCQQVGFLWGSWGEVLSQASLLGSRRPQALHLLTCLLLWVSGPHACFCQDVSCQSCWKCSLQGARSNPVLS